MEFWVVVVFVVVAISVVVFAAGRANELFCLSVRDGSVLVVRGRVLPALLRDIREIVARPPVFQATIRAVRLDGAAQLQATGDLDEGRLQRLRNVLHLFPLARLRAAPRLDRPNLGQRLGIAWLAWRYHRP